MQPIRLQDLAAALGREFDGDPDLEIRGVAPLEGAGPGDLTFARSEPGAYGVRCNHYETQPDGPVRVWDGSMRVELGENDVAHVELKVTRK